MLDSTTTDPKAAEIAQASLSLSDFGSEAGSVLLGTWLGDSFMCSRINPINTF